MSDRHVVPAESGWQVEKVNAKRPSAKAPTQAEAVQRAMEIVANDGGGRVVVYRADGTVRETRTVTRDADDTTAPAAVAAAPPAKGAQAADTATTMADGTSATADKIAGTTHVTTEKAADTAEEASGDVADELADAVNGRVGAEVAGAARGPDEALIDGADRAAEVGEDLGDQLQTASHRAGRYIHSVTERAAGPLDAAAHALNPVRIAGRTAGVVIAGALYVGALVTSRGTRRARRSTRSVTGRG